MQHVKHLITIGFMALGAPAIADSFETIKVNAGEALFTAECRRCHAPNATDPSYGPLLEGVVGRKAGAVEGYAYSEALGNAGFVWTTGALKAWIEDNDHFLPGTKMRHVGIEDPTVQDFILTYLESISG